MSDTDADNLSRQKIQQLLAAVGSRPAEDNTETQAKEYDWHQPHYFSIEHLEKLNDFAKDFVTAVAERFNSLYQSDFDVTISSITQHFAAEFYNETSDNQPEYFLTFGSDETHLFGAVVIPFKTAAVWAKQLLGDSEAGGDSDKDLSQLEVSLLSEIGVGIVGAFSSSYESFNFHPANGFVKGQLPLHLTGSQELCKIAFEVKKADSENTSAAYLLILCNELDAVAGKSTSVDAAGALSPEEVSQALREHVEQMHVKVTAQLASTQIAFDEILNLQVDDILVLDKRIDEPLELMVDDRRVYYCRPAKSAGRYAVVFTENLK